MSKKSKEVKPSNEWWCNTCKTPSMTQAEAVNHLQVVHGVETKGLKVSKRMLMHMDGDTWFSSQYEVTIPCEVGEIKMTHSTMTPRAKDDMMRHA